MKKKICSVGECMMEFSNLEKNSYNQSIAGDTLNFSSYLDKNIFNSFYLTAIGSSDISSSVLNFLKQRKINVNLVKRISTHEIGLYLIKNNNSGEKKFYYWRDNSAAKFFFNNKNIKYYYNKLKFFNYLYFTGITLSLFNKTRRSQFVKLITFLKKRKIQIIFDLNIRISRWDKKELDIALSQILSKIDILFASGEDLSVWKGDKSLKMFKKILEKYKISHGIYRKNAQFNYSFLNNKKYLIKNKVLRNVIDTSGAGDGYNAAYISNFANHRNPQYALENASKIGAKIVMKKGAIVNVG